MDCFEDPPLWICKFGPKLLQGDPVRGYWILHIPSNKLWETWNKLTVMTESGQLGYRVSKCRKPMTFGSYKGLTSICCFAIAEESQQVLRVLDEAGFCEFTYEFRLLKKFRPKDEVSEMEDYFDYEF